SIDEFRVPSWEIRTSRLDIDAVMRRVQEGWTLIINNIDEMVPNVRRICDSLEWGLQTYFCANAYVSAGKEQGFPLTWDSQETLILQIVGPKHWTIHRPTLCYPTEFGDRRPAAPTDVPVWSGELHAGAMFHVPRGWWHAVRPCGVPSLHLTFCACPPTGM